MNLKYLFAAFSVYLFQGLFSQTYNFSKYSDENGLKQSYIYSISQSKEGQLVMSTGEAVCFFDGHKFSTVSDPKMTEAIVSTHLVDSRNITWLGHQLNGLAFINNGKYFKINNKLVNEIKINQILEDEESNIWLASSAGLFTIDSNLKITAFKIPQIKNITSLCLDQRNNLLAGTSEGLAILAVSSNKEVKLIEFLNALRDKNIKQVIRSSSHNYIALVDGEGIYTLTNKKGKYEVLFRINEQLLPGNYNASYIYSDKSKNIWVSVFGDGLRKISFKGDLSEENYSVTRIDQSNGLKSKNIQSIFQDEEGNMWFGTFGEGLIKKPVELFSFYEKKEGLLLTDITSVFSDTNKNVWMGTANGFAVFKPETNSYQLYNETNGFINDKVNDLISDEKGKIWIGTNENGIYNFDPVTKKFKSFLDRKSGDHFSVNTILQTDDKILFGTTDGIYAINKLTGQRDAVTTNEGLLHNNVLHLFKDSKNRLWVSSHGTPPYYIQNQKITSFKKIPGLISFNINAVCEDKQGNIWIASEGDGVFKYNNKTFYNYTTNHGLLSNYCNGIETDRDNSVWVTHASGLSELKEFHIKFSTFTTQRGLLFSENNRNAVFKDKDTILWFGTTQGIMRYDAEAEGSGSKIPEIFITKIMLNNTAYSPKDIIVKNYGYYLVHIDFKAVSLSEPEAIYYKYRLTDVDSSWKTTTLPFIDLPKLGDGDYTFEIMACNSNNGLCSSIPASVSFTINKPVWKSSWFYILLAIAIIAIFYIIILMRIKNLKKTHALLQFKIDQKTFLLQKEKEAVETIKVELERKNTDITASIQYAKNIQDSLLPPEELLKDLFFDNYFVLYKPKDIVSGDFYWCTGPKTNSASPLHLASIIDCTGHGVPGAFLSILANDFLKQSIADKKVNKPNEILNFLNKNISAHLNQSASKRITDGMDISLIGIDYLQNKLYYSGANNPIYIYRKAENNCVEEIIIKPTKQAIGSSNEKIVDYELHIIDLKKGDTIYMFSDGYADQFGGEKNKKITYKRFRTILSEAFVLPIEQQKKYMETKLEEWRNGLEQTDDICVMGIKI